MASRREHGGAAAAVALARRPNGGGERGGRARADELKGSKAWLLPWTAGSGVRPAIVCGLHGQAASDARRHAAIKF